MGKVLFLGFWFWFFGILGFWVFCIFFIGNLL